MEKLNSDIRELGLNNYFAAFVALVTGGLLVYVMNVEARYALYLVAFALAVLFFYLAETPVLKVGFILFVLFFIERVFVHNRLLTDYFLVSITLVFTVLTLLTMDKDFNRFKREYFSRAVWGCFLLLAALSIFLHEELTRETFIKQLYVFQLHYLEFFLLFLVGFLAFRNVHDVGVFLKVFILFCGIVAVAHVFSILTGINLEALRGADAVVSHRDLSDAKNWRYGGFFSNPNYMAAIYVMVTPGCLLILSEKRAFFFKILAGLVLTVVLFSLALTGSRGGMMFTLINCALIILIYVKGTVRRVSMVAILCLFLFVAYSIADHYFYEHLQRSISRIEVKNFEDDVRWDIWLGTLQVIVNNPIGLGLDGHAFANRLYNYSGYYFEHAHNVFLSVAAHNGIAGLLLFLTLIGKILLRLITKVRALPKDQALVCAFALSIITGYLLTGLTNGTFINNVKINHFFGLILGLCAFLNYTLDDTSSPLTSQKEGSQEVCK